MIPKRPPRIGITLLDDAGFDAAFGALGIPGRDEAHWRLLADAVAADLAVAGEVGDGQPLRVAATVQPESGGGGPRGGGIGVDVALPPLGIEPPERLKAPRFSPPRRWMRPAAVTAALALAALVLFSLRTPPHGDPALMVPRGVSGPLDHVAPALDVSVAVKNATGTERFQPDRAYAVGDTLMFEVNLPEPATVELRRGGGSEVDGLLWSGSVDAGRQTLPVGYALEPGEAAVHLKLWAYFGVPTAEVAVAYVNVRVGAEQPQ